MASENINFFSVLTLFLFVLKFYESFCHIYLPPDLYDSFLRQKLIILLLI